jgi:pSer/pThr/pTyr-binding forkhead associated (FHA) protein
MKKSQCLDPVELELSLRRTIEKNTHDFIGSMVVPDMYTIVIEENLFEEYGELLHTLGKMLRDSLDSWIRDKGYWCEGGTRILFEKGDTENKGFLIRISYKALIERGPEKADDLPEPSPGEERADTEDEGIQNALVAELVSEATGDAFTVTDKGLLVGRGEECDIRAAEGTVSESHARLSLEYGKITVEDLASTNGTRVNLRRIRKAVLHDGDRISFGGAEFTFVLKTCPVATALRVPPVLEGITTTGE